MRALVLVIAACGSSSSSPPAPVEQRAAADARLSADAPSIDAAAIIAKDWPDGCFTFRDASNVIHVSDRARCDLPRRPYSTFKIVNALIAVDAGILAGPDASMTWDKRAIPDTPRFRDAWRKPHTLRTGMAVSAVPYFRTLALQLGEARMRAGLASLDYGNQDLSGGLDRFWLTAGGIRVSAAQQLALVEGLAHRRLGMSRHAQDTVSDVIELARDGAAVLRGKTGTGPIEDTKGGWIAWQVGWVEHGKTIIPYACWMESHEADIDAVRAAREQRLRAILGALAVFPAP